MKRNLGVYFIAGLVTLNILLWAFFGPTTGVSKNFPQQVVAETLSSSAMILWASGIFLSNKPRFLVPPSRAGMETSAPVAFCTRWQGEIP